MSFVARGSLGTALAVVVFPATAAMALAAPCSNDAFTVHGSAITVELCEAPAAKANARGSAILETIALKDRAPLVRRVPLDLVPGEEVAHTIDDAPLASLGIAGTLHMTIGYKVGTVRLEHALLVPGAIALK